MPRKTEKPDRIEPIAVSPAVARQLLDCCHVTLYKLINDREIDSFSVGRSRKITTASIKAYIARQIAANADKIEKARAPLNPYQKAAADAQPS